MPRDGAKSAGRRPVQVIAGWVTGIGLPLVAGLAALPMILPWLSERYEPPIEAEDLGYSTLPAAAVVGYELIVLFPTSRSQAASLKCNGYRQVQIAEGLRGWVAVTQGIGEVPPQWTFLEDDIGFANACARQWEAIIDRLDRDEGRQRSELTPR